MYNGDVEARRDRVNVDIAHRKKPCRDDVSDTVVTADLSCTSRVLMQRTQAMIALSVIRKCCLNLASDLSNHKRSEALGAGRTWGGVASNILCTCWIPSHCGETRTF